MSKYTVAVRTTHYVEFTVDADSKEAAIEEAESEFENLEDYGDVEDVNYEIVEEHND